MAAGSESPSRGTERLLGDCARMEQVLSSPRPPAWERLEAKVGAELARELLALVREWMPEQEDD